MNLILILLIQLFQDAVAAVDVDRWEKKQLYFELR
jgi:hypothetical protein